MKSVEIMTCNSMYKNGECIGGYHEIHVINYLQNTNHLIATIDSIIDNNILYGCDDTVLDGVCISCDDKNVANAIDNHYKGFYREVKVNIN